VANLKKNSPFADMLPAGKDFFYHPFDSARMFLEVLKLDEMRTSAEVAAKRGRQVDDVEKRNKYRKAHGLNQEQGFASMLGLGKAKEEEAVEAVAAVEEPTPVAVPEPIAAVPEEMVQGPRKKFLGIF